MPNSPSLGCLSTRESKPRQFSTQPKPLGRLPDPNKGSTLIIRILGGNWVIFPWFRTDKVASIIRLIKATCTKSVEEIQKVR